MVRVTVSSTTSPSSASAGAKRGGDGGGHVLSCTLFAILILASSTTSAFLSSSSTTSSTAMWKQQQQQQQAEQAWKSQVGFGTRPPFSAASTRLYYKDDKASNSTDDAVSSSMSTTTSEQSSTNGTTAVKPTNTTNTATVSGSSTSKVPSDSEAKKSSSSSKSASKKKKTTAKATTADEQTTSSKSTATSTKTTEKPRSSTPPPEPAAPTTRAPPTKLEIPVLGPFLNSQPLLIGETMWLSPPTSLQWKTIEICVEAQAASKNPPPNGTVAEGATSESTATATVDAAPLVAILHSSPSTGGRGATRMATVAAIVGIVDETQKKVLDTSDSESFRESLEGYLRKGMYSDTAKVRFLGVGRARLSSFVTRIMDEADVDDDDDDDGEGGEEEGTVSSSNDLKSGKGGTAFGQGKQKMTFEYYDEDTGELVDDDDDDDDDDVVYGEPVLMAQDFQFVMDLIGSSRMYSNPERSEYYDYGKNVQMSPAHAVSQSSLIYARLRFLHQDRRDLVQKLRAAQSRLDMASESWEDWDGIGGLFSGDGTSSTSTSTSTSSKKVVDVEDDAVSKAKKQEDEAKSEASSSTPSSNATTSGPATDDSTFTTEEKPVLSPMAAKVAELDNYGLGSTSSAYSELPSMTKMLLEDILKPYYSPNLVNGSEEFYYSIGSWVALQSMKTFLVGISPEHFQQAFESLHTQDRLEMLFDAMTAHKDALQELVQAKAQELKDCGEECTDLFPN